MSAVSDLELIRDLQEGLPLVSRPFAAVAEQLGLPEGEVLERLARLKREGKVRRVAASISHRRAGFTANAMCVWSVPADQVDEVGARLAEFAEVTHCYARPAPPDFPYNVYTMIHGRSRDDCERVIARIREATGLSEYVILYSDREFKKTSTRV